MFTFYAQVLNPNTVVALGLFPAVAMYNHSCDPNCTLLGEGDESCTWMSRAWMSHALGPQLSG